MNAENFKPRCPSVVRPRLFHSSLKSMKTKSAPLTAQVFVVLVVVADAAREVVDVILVMFDAEALQHEIHDEFGMELVHDPLQVLGIDFIGIEVNDQAPKSASRRGFRPDEGDHGRRDPFGPIRVGLVHATCGLNHGVGDELLKLGVSEAVCEKPKLNELSENWLNLRHDARNTTEEMLRADRNLLFVDPVDIGLEGADIHFRD
jgi:hypothetical protein